MIKTFQLRKEYRMGDSIVHALDGVDFKLDAGEFVSITGPSGSGKSTLMHILGCLDRPTSGELVFNDQHISTLSERQLARIRNQHIGFVFQTFNLINRTTALDNVVVPLVYTRKSYSKSNARQALDRVGLGHRCKHTPSEMSGGECQRVAIARALVNKPSLILADEPTGNLDTRTGRQIMQLFHELHAEGIAILLVTHELEVAVQTNRLVQMRDGKIVEDTAVTEVRRQEILALTRDAHALAASNSSEGGSAVSTQSPQPDTSSLMAEN